MHSVSAPGFLSMQQDSNSGHGHLSCFLVTQYLLSSIPVVGQFPPLCTLPPWGGCPPPNALEARRVKGARLQWVKIQQADRSGWVMAGPPSFPMCLGGRKCQGRAQACAGAMSPWGLHRGCSHMQGFPTQPQAPPREAVNGLGSFNELLSTWTNWSGFCCFLLKNTDREE